MIQSDIIANMKKYRGTYTIKLTLRKLDGNVSFNVIDGITTFKPGFEWQMNVYLAHLDRELGCDITVHARWLVQRTWNECAVFDMCLADYINEVEQVPVFPGKYSERSEIFGYNSDAYHIYWRGGQ